MAKRERALRPGEAQQRRATFCARLLGYLVVFGFFSAIVVGIPFPDIWRAVFVPFLTVSLYLFPLLTVWFLVRMSWLKARARHYRAMTKLSSDPDFK